MGGEGLGLVGLRGVKPPPYFFVPGVWPGPSSLPSLLFFFFCARNEAHQPQLKCVRKSETASPAPPSSLYALHTPHHVASPLHAHRHARS